MPHSSHRSALSRSQRRGAAQFTHNTFTLNTLRLHFGSTDFLAVAEEFRDSNSSDNLIYSVLFSIRTELGDTNSHGTNCSREALSRHLANGDVHCVWT